MSEEQVTIPALTEEEINLVTLDEGFWSNLFKSPQEKNDAYSKKFLEFHRQKNKKNAEELSRANIERDKQLAQIRQYNQDKLTKKLKGDVAKPKGVIRKLYDKAAPWRDHEEIDPKINPEKNLALPKTNFEAPVFQALPKDEKGSEYGAGVYADANKSKKYKDDNGNEIDITKPARNFKPASYGNMEDDDVEDLKSLANNVARYTNHEVQPAYKQHSNIVKKSAIPPSAANPIPWHHEIEAEPSKEETPIIPVPKNIKTSVAPQVVNPAASAGARIANTLIATQNTAKGTPLNLKINDTTNYTPLAVKPLSKSFSGNPSRVAFDKKNIQNGDLNLTPQSLLPPPKKAAAAIKKDRIHKDIPRYLERTATIGRNTGLPSIVGRTIDPKDANHLIRKIRNRPKDVSDDFELMQDQIQWLTDLHPMNEDIGNCLITVKEQDVIDIFAKRYTMRYNN